MTDFPSQIETTRTKIAQHSAAAPRRSSTSSLYRRVGKRVFDIVASLAICVFALPLTALLALCVLLEGYNPFYSQLRIGKDDRAFRMWKLRTMVPNAGVKLAAHLANDPAAQLEWDTMQKLKNDPRITRTGLWLRRTSLDELPQLVNVLLGTMSLVGPRPMMVEQGDSYQGDSYYRMLPGMTGPWQVSERSESTFSARVGHDDSYYEQMSLRLDLTLIARTVLVVFKGTGQ